MALIGHGSKLTILGPTGTTTVNKILACMSIDFGSDKVDTHDTTDMLTPGTQRVKIPGLENSGDLAIKFNVKPGDASQQALRAAKGQLYDYVVTYPGNVRTRSFTGIVSSIDESIPDDKAATGSAKIDISGAIADTDAAVVNVPQVVGLTLAAATTAIVAAGLVLGTNTPQSGSGVTVGDVISQSPVAGSPAITGSAVNVVTES
jgi:hypothetical protein